jgi:hypothetical protein
MSEPANNKGEPHTRGRWLMWTSGVLAVISLLIASQMKWFWWYGPHVVYRRDFTEVKTDAAWCWPELLMIGLASLALMLGTLLSARRCARLCSVLLLICCGISCLFGGSQSVFAEIGLLSEPFLAQGTGTTLPSEWWQNDWVSIQMVLDPAWTAAWVVGVIGLFAGATGVYLFRPPNDPERFVLCAFCRYNLRGVLGKNCPECGVQIPPHKQELIRDDLKKTAAGQAAAKNREI